MSEKIRGNAGFGIAIVGLCMIAVAIVIPMSLGTSLHDVLMSVNGFFVAVGIGAVLAGAKNMPKR